MIHSYSNLVKFCSFYFNQDWMYLYGDEKALIDDFKHRNPEEFVRDVERELTELLQNNLATALNESSLYDLLGCACLPSVDGITNTEWLKQLLVFMTENESSPR